MRRFILLVAALACLAPSIPAEDIVLIDGRYLHVKILQDSETGIQVQLLDTGGQVFIPWALIYEPDRVRIMKDRGRMTEEKVLVEEGNRITTKTGDTWEGRIINETDKEVTLKNRGTTMTIAKDRIKETEKLPVDATIIGIVDTVNVNNTTIFDAKR